MPRMMSALLFVMMTAVFCMSVAVSSSTAIGKIDGEFSIREYDEFHDVLHPLQHEALPAKDFRRIRANAPELLKRGDAIVRLGVPKGTADAQAEEFRRELKKFADALGKFRQHSQKGTDEQLEASFSAVHDSFEMLAGMLPRKQSN